MTKKHLLIIAAVMTAMMLAACGGSATPTPTEALPTPTAIVAAATATPRPTPVGHETVAAPDFTLQTLDGEEVSLSDYRGKLVMLNFWATWCPPCNAEMPDLQHYYEQHQDEDFIILGINYEGSPEEVGDFVKKYDVTFPILLDSDGRIAQLFGVQGLPTSFFVDKEGNVLGYQPGPVTKEMLEQGLTPLLQQP